MIKLCLSIETHSGRIYYIKNKQRRVINSAQTTGENSKAAMGVSIATHKDYRHQGLMTKLLSRLCRDLLSEGKRLCLFEIYHKLGFKPL